MSTSAIKEAIASHTFMSTYFKWVKAEETREVDKEAYRKLIRDHLVTKGFQLEAIDEVLGTPAPVNDLSKYLQEFA